MFPAVKHFDRAEKNPIIALHSWLLAPLLALSFLADFSSSSISQWSPDPVCLD